MAAPAAARWGGVALAAACALMAVHAVRSAGVAAFAGTAPERAAAFWPGHPDVLTGQALAAIGRAAAEGRPPGEDALNLLREAALRQPLGVEPLLAEGTARLARGDAAAAERLLVAALRRDPRSAAGRYLLADLYLRGGRVREGLEQVVALGRRYPPAVEQMAPALAAVAASEGVVDLVRPMLARDPVLRGAVLNKLARDGAQAERVLVLAGDGQKPEPWHARLVQALVERGEYGRARAVWSRLSGSAVAEGAALFNARFSGSSAPPPFNWELGGGAGGLAEPGRGGRLRIIYYGREPVVLARQLVLLAPGAYRLTHQLSGSQADAGALEWAVRCARDGAELLRGRPAAVTELRFSVPAGCRAQWLELRGVPWELERTTSVELSGLGLAREPGQ